MLTDSLVKVESTMFLHCQDSIYPFVTKKHCCGEILCEYLVPNQTLTHVLQHKLMMLAESVIATKVEEQSLR